MDDNKLEKIYQENLDERIIMRIAELEEIPLDKAMKILFKQIV